MLCYTYADCFVLHGYKELKRTYAMQNYAYGILGKSSWLTQEFFILTNMDTLQMMRGLG